jgi:hypothetical protein
MESLFDDVAIFHSGETSVEAVPPDSKHEMFLVLFNSGIAQQTRPEIVHRKRISS